MGFPFPFMIAMKNMRLVLRWQTTICDQVVDGFFQFL